MRVLATIGALATLGAVAVDTAEAKPKKRDAAFGYIESGALRGTFSAHRDGTGPVTGSFTGSIRFGHSAGLSIVKGPITCLEVSEDRVGFFYPFSEPNLKDSGMLVSIETNGASRVKQMTYSVRSTAETTSCGPEAAGQYATGVVTLRPR